MYIKFYFFPILIILTTFYNVARADVLWPATFYRERYYFSNGYMDVKKQTPGYEYLPNIVNNELDLIGYPVLNDSTTRRLPTVSKYSDFEFIWNGTVPSPLCIIESNFTLSETTVQVTAEKNMSTYLYQQANFFPPEDLSCQYVNRPTFCLQINTNWTFSETSQVEFSTADNLWLFLDNQLIFDNGGYTNGQQQYFSLDFESGKYSWSFNDTQVLYSFDASQFYNKLTKLDIYHCKFIVNETLSFSIVNSTATIKPTPTPTSNPTPTPTSEIGECDRSPQPFKCKKGPVIAVAIVGAAVAAAAIGAAAFFAKKKFEQINVPSGNAMGNVQNNPLFVHKSIPIYNEKIATYLNCLFECAQRCRCLHQSCALTDLNESDIPISKKAINEQSTDEDALKSLQVINLFMILIQFNFQQIFEGLEGLSHDDKQKMYQFKFKDYVQNQIDLSPSKNVPSLFDCILYEVIEFIEYSISFVYVTRY
ncbi:hypothetical protein PPL_07273 [Heterostelium album PN500]|uniref:PA14 domain-containing protein n=1 Tax=Heterostelium pallidum (strain ATCC 26659 / Pp 5 / PN500) TaxID=670386 RepID=D3BEV7_HETP5|nr:hypothetical protein PPL_07273 [Heterostelium album PN500]EFA80438.1 hypothetical protein PPL_07273 [Heterostelium album PN500]|eukprot:XP_020432558.1 hypothetical protein PPL_07273 [Heterostelium album PN500]